eukprot:2835234-Pleurochrysis_carterae.AAC.2
MRPRRSKRYQARPRVIMRSDEGGARARACERVPHLRASLASRIASLILSSLVSSAGVRPFRSSETVEAPCTSSLSTASRCFLKAAKCSGLCIFSFGSSMHASEGDASKASSTSTCPRRDARETAVPPIYPFVFTFTPASSKNLTASSCPASAAQMSGVLPLSSWASSCSKAKLRRAATSPFLAASHAIEPGFGIG